jgi:hypothetical protein
MAAPEPMRRAPAGTAVSPQILGWTGRKPFSTKPVLPAARVAQSVEQRIENPRVGSSILSLGTIKLNKINILRAKAILSVRIAFIFSPKLNPRKISVL